MVMLDLYVKCRSTIKTSYPLGSITGSFSIIECHLQFANKIETTLTKNKLVFLKR